MSDFFIEFIVLKIKMPFEIGLHKELIYDEEKKRIFLYTTRDEIINTEDYRIKQSICNRISEAIFNEDSCLVSIFKKFEDTFYVIELDYVMCQGLDIIDDYPSAEMFFYNYKVELKEFDYSAVYITFIDFNAHIENNNTIVLQGCAHCFSEEVEIQQIFATLSNNSLRHKRQYAY